MSQYNFGKFSDLELMIGNIYGEAALIETASNVEYSVPADEAREYLAICSVVMNRVESPFFPNWIKGVILQKKQFSWTISEKHGAKRVYDFLSKMGNSKQYKKYKSWAEAVMAGRSRDFSNGSDHYMAVWLYHRISDDHWGKKKEIRAIHGGHVFLK